MKNLVTLVSSVVFMRSLRAVGVRPLLWLYEHGLQLISKDTNVTVLRKTVMDNLSNAPNPDKEVLHSFRV